MNETGSVCTSCTRPEPDAYLCPTCTKTMRQWLYELAGHARDLREVVLPRLTSARSVKVMVRGTSGSPLGYNPHAADALAELRAALVAIVRELAERLGPDEMLPANTEAAMARWLARRTEHVALHPSAPETYAMVRHRVEQVRRVVDIPPERRLLGPCDAVVDGRVCGLDVRASEGEATTLCNCLTAHDVVAFQLRVLARLGGSLRTAREIAAILSGQVRADTVTKWKRRRVRLSNGMAFDSQGTEPWGAEVYRVGDVLDVLNQEQRARRHVS